MSDTISADRFVNRLVRRKEWGDRSAKIVWIIAGILFVGILVVLFAFPMLTSLMVNEDDPASLAWGWSVQTSYFHKAWDLSAKPFFIGIALWFGSITVWGLALFALNSEKRRAKQAPEQMLIIESLISRVKNGDLGYHEGVKTVMGYFGVDSYDMDAWPAWQESSREEHKAIWDKFRLQFEFNPGGLPAIKEPIPSITYHIPLHDIDSEQNLQECLLHGFQRLMPERDWIYAADW